jgi:hypothetical protein
MPMRVQWEPGYETGHALVDAQHQELLGLCKLLADHFAGPGDDAADAERFDQVYARLRTLAREHFDAEAAQRAGSGETDDRTTTGSSAMSSSTWPDEIATTGNFDRLELQRFLTLWWLGHVTGAVQRQRELQAGDKAIG